MTWNYFTLCALDFSVVLCCQFPLLKFISFLQSLTSTLNYCIDSCLFECLVTKWHNPAISRVFQVFRLSSQMKPFLRSEKGKFIVVNSGSDCNATTRGEIFKNYLLEMMQVVEHFSISIILLISNFNCSVMSRFCWHEGL